MSKNLSEANQSSKSTTALIKRLSLAVGVTGYDGPDAVHQVIVEEMTPLVDRVEQDRMGSVTGVKEGQQSGTEGKTRRKVMLAAHLDEIGAIVTKVDRGFLRFTQIGGLDDRVLMGQEVIVHGQRDLPGIIGSVSPHLLPAKQPDTVDQADMHVDVGLPPRQVERLVQIGDLISFGRPPAELLSGLLSGKAMDNRASVAAMLLCLQELGSMQHQWDVYAVATANEEWGGNYVGATTQAYVIRPDVAIVLDMTFADVEEIDIKMNEGPAIGLGPSNHPLVRERLLEICRERELKYQSEIMPSGAGTDAYAVEISREGIPTVLLSIPSRYMHSPVEVVQPKDVKRTARLLAYFIAGLDEEFVETLIPK